MIELFWLSQGSKYALVNVLQGSEYYSGSKHDRAWNIARLWTYKGLKGHWICWMSLNLPLKCLSMPEYASLMLNILEYAWITWFNRILNTTEFSICLMRTAGDHCTNYWAVIETETFSEHCQIFKMGRLGKE